MNIQRYSIGTVIDADQEGRFILHSDFLAALAEAHLTIGSERLASETLKARIAELEKQLIQNIDPSAPVEELKGSMPLVLYFANDEDREEFIQAALEAMPTMKARKL